MAYEEIKNAELAKRAEKLMEIETNLRAAKERGVQVDPSEILRDPVESFNSMDTHESFNSGGAPTRRTNKQKSFSEMTVEEMEASLAQREKLLRR